MKKLSIITLSLSACILLGSCSSRSSKSRNDDNEDSATESSEDSYKSEITDVVEKWNKSLNLRDEQMSAEVYAPDVMFYGQNLSGSTCAEKRVDMAMSDPTWQQEIISEIHMEKQDDGTVIANFTKQSTGKKGTHTYPSYLILKKFHSDWKIINESDKLTDKNLEKRKNRKIPDDAVRGDFDGDGKIDNVWVDAKYDSEGYVKGKIRLKSDNPALEGMSWNATRDVILINVGDLNNSNRDFLAVIPCYDSSWTVFETYGYKGYKNGKWATAVPAFDIWTGNEDFKRVWKSSRKGYVVISTNDMSAPDGGFENTTREVKLNF